MTTPKVIEGCACRRADTHRLFAELVLECGGGRIAAPKLGLSRSYVTMLAGRQRCPGRGAIEAIARVFNIAPEQWMHLEDAT